MTTSDLTIEDLYQVTELNSLSPRCGVCGPPGLQCGGGGGVCGHPALGLSPV